MGALKLEGQRFGRLIAIKPTSKRTFSRSIIWLCQCDCGNIKEVMASNLRSGVIQSCRCLQKERVSKANTTHGYSMNGTMARTYRSWGMLRSRCNNPKDPAYKNYGGRSIKVCKRWDKFENFLEDMGKRPEGMTIDRIDNDGNYEPDNCRWATIGQQIRNSRHTKLNILKVQVIKKLLKESNLTQGDIGEIFNVAGQTISNIKLELAWKDINY